ncbi:hypothetical protein COF68_06330 [Bacillus toyonensis]|uniref:hypothetical protein n=1 Tax=Bacillus toyonensis TaxID=155322 RepID=UPI000BFB887B|nr:hypothetical protein [Bacillus toyonensis]PHE64451.1 hypothetical protein COF68_06330 [Bacillus toyonensis]
MENLDFDFLKQLSTIHNLVNLGDKQESEFHSFLLENKEKFNHTEYLVVAMEQFELTEEYIEKNFESCKFVYDYFKSNEDLALCTTGLRTGIRLGVFEQLVEDHLKQENKE